MMHMYRYGYPGCNPWMLIPMAIGFIVVIGFGILIMKRMRSNGYGTNNTLQILDEKFVKGEISEEEYLQKKKVIKGK